MKLICQWCGKEYEVYPCKSNSKYCSWDCKSKAQSSTMRDIRNGTYKKKQYPPKQCLNCNKTFIPVKSTVRFCSKKCYSESRHKILICKNCGSEFKVLKSTKGIKFCSEECKKEYHQNHYHEIKECSVCGKTFTSLKSKNRICCSAQCAVKYRENKVAIKCKECGKIFYVKPVKSNTAKFCSKECYSKWCIENWRGENNHNWHGGSSGYRGENWNEQRAKARDRDNYTCLRCLAKLNNGELYEAFVHHIIPFKFFTDYIEANELKNLKTLCRKCHGKEEAKIRSNAEQLRQKLNVENLPDLLNIIKTWFEEENGILVWR